MTRRCWAVAVLVAAMLATAACGSDSSGGGTSATATPSGQMVLATTTSTRDTGLLDTLVPAFEKASKCSVKTVAVGSGQAIDLGARGQADVLLVHSPDAEKTFMAAGPRRQPPGRHAQRLRARRSAVRSREGRRRRRDRPCDAGHRARRSLRSPRAPTTRAPTRRSSSSGSRRASPRRGRGTSRPVRAWDRR